MKKSKNPKIVNKYLWLNVLTLVTEAFVLSTTFISISLVNILRNEPSKLIMLLIIISLILPIVSYLLIRIDTKKNIGHIPKFRIITNMIYLFFSIIFEIAAIVATTLTFMIY